MKIRALIVIFILIVLAIGNPTKESLISQSVKRLVPKNDEKAGLLISLAIAGFAKQIERTAIRKNYILFSKGEYRLARGIVHSVGTLWVWVTYKTEE